MTPQALAALHAAAFPDARPWSAREFGDLLAASGTRLHGDARGFLLGRIVADEAEILLLATHPDHRRQGIAAANIAAFHAAARDAGARRIFLEVAADNAPARAAYAAAGFLESGRRRGYYPRASGPAADALVLARAP